ncbi:MAG: MATE family efflux transporter [Bacteroidales bacterium]
MKIKDTIKFASGKFKPLLFDIYEAIKGTEKDYTEGRISKAILLLAIPMVLEMVMESVFVIVDIYFVAQLNADAVAVVGITESIMTLVYAISVGLSTATTAIVARRIGEKRPEEAANSAFIAILTAIMVSFIFAIPGFFFSREILELMGVSEQAINQGHYFTMIMLSGNVVIILLFVMNAVFRSAGDAAISMRVLWVANIINLILDPCFIFGLGPFPELGVTGAAVATTTGRGIAVLFQFYLLVYGKKRVQIKFRYIQLKFQEFIQLIKLSLGGIGQSLIATSSWIILMRILSKYGNEVVAGYTIAIRIIIFVLLPAWGLSNAASTLVGQNLGAKKPERAEKSVWIAGFSNVIFMGFLSIFFVAFSGYFIEILAGNEDARVIEYGSKALRIISIGFPAYAIGMVMIQAINGAGDTTTPTIINFFTFWMIEIPLAAFLSLYYGYEYTGVFYSILISETLMAVIGMIIFKRGKWKSKIV